MITIGNGYRLTAHAQKRFAERFPDLDLAYIWAKAFMNRTGKSMLRRIRKQCPKHRDVTIGAFRGYYYKVAEKHKVVFVVAPPKTIITVFPLEDEPPQ